MIITKNSDKNAFYDSYVFLYGHVQASLAVTLSHDLNRF